MTARDRASRKCSSPSRSLGDTEAWGHRKPHLLRGRCEQLFSANVFDLLQVTELSPAAAAPVRQPAPMIPTTKQARKPPVELHGALHEAVGILFLEVV